MIRQIILDTETTGLDINQGHRIIEIACVELINRKITDNNYHCYLNPQREIDSQASAIHGITTEFLEDKPSFHSIAEDFLNFIQGAELIIHNASFDVGFINYEFSLTQKNYLPLTEYCNITDTLEFARKLHPGMRNNLDALCKRYGINNAHRAYHGALLDAHLLAQVYLIMSAEQRSLLDGLEFESLKKNVSSLKSGKNYQGKIIKANIDELAMHESYMQNIQKT